jgi:hypothetical protein
MKHTTSFILLAGLLTCGPRLFAADPAETGAKPPPLDPNGAYVIKLERPFSRENVPDWLPLRVSVTLKDGRPSSAVAFAHHFNAAWHTVDVSKLACADGRLKGEIGMGLRWDDIQRAADQLSKADSTKQIRGPGWADGTMQAIAVDVPIAAEPVGTRTGTASWTTVTLDARLKGSETEARAWPVAVPAASKPVYLEFGLGTWALPRRRASNEMFLFSPEPSYDGTPCGGFLLLRCTVRDGKAGDWVVFQAPERYSMNTADQVWSVGEAAVQSDGRTLRGSLTLIPHPEMTGKSTKFIPLPDKPVTVKLEASLSGLTVAGTAAVTLDGQTHASDIYGRMRSYPFAAFADRSPRAWSYTRQPDAKLVELARKEASVAIRPGEPGKRDFWTEYATQGGCSFRGEKDGHRMVQMGNELWTYEEFRSKKQGIGSLNCIAAPSFNLGKVPGATRHRFTLTARGAKESLTFEAAEPWTPLGEIWDQAPVGDLVLRVTGLDAAGKEVGKPFEFGLNKRTAFNGPYFEAPRSLREAALMHARWMRDNPRNGPGRGIYCEPVGSASGDGQLWYITYSGAWAGLIVHALSPDPIERADGLEMATAIAGDQWLRSFAEHFVPDTYKGWTFDQWIYGTTWLDLYRLTGEPRYAEAAKFLASQIAKCQLPSGTWVEVLPTTNRQRPQPDPVTGLYQISPFKAIPGWPQEWDPSSLLYFYGRVRKDLKTDEFRACEDKTWTWLQENSIARFDWRRQGPGESAHTQHPWFTQPDYAREIRTHTGNLAGNTEYQQAMQTLPDNAASYFYCDTRTLARPLHAVVRANFPDTTVPFPSADCLGRHLTPYVSATVPTPQVETTTTLSPLGKPLTLAVGMAGLYFAVQPYLADFIPMLPRTFSGTAVPVPPTENQTAPSQTPAS